MRTVQVGQEKPHGLQAFGEVVVDATGTQAGLYRDLLMTQPFEVFEFYHHLAAGREFLPGLVDLRFQPDFFLCEDDLFLDAVVGHFQLHDRHGFTLTARMIRQFVPEARRDVVPGIPDLRPIDIFFNKAQKNLIDQILDQLGRSPRIKADFEQIRIMFPVESNIVFICMRGDRHRGKLRKRIKNEQ